MQPELWVWEPRAAGEWGSRKAEAERNSHSRARGAGIQSTGEAVNKQEEMLMFQIHIWALTETPG